MKSLAAFRGLVTLMGLFIGGQTLATDYKIKVGSPLSISKMLSGDIGERIEVTLTSNNQMQLVHMVLLSFYPPAQPI